MLFIQLVTLIAFCSYCSSGRESAKEKKQTKFNHDSIISSVHNKSLHFPSNKIIASSAISKSNDAKNRSSQDVLREKKIVEEKDAGKGSNDDVDENNEKTTIPESKPSPVSALDSSIHSKRRHNTTNSKSSNSSSRYVCVFHNNWRTASLFELNVLLLRGNSSIDYIVNDISEEPKARCEINKSTSDYNIELIRIKNRGFAQIDSNLTDKLKEYLLSKPLKAIISGDEQCSCKQADCGSFPNPKSIVGREYFTEKLMHNWEFSPSFNTRPNSIAYIPLGPRQDFGLVPLSSPRTKKLWVFNLIISPTTVARKRLAAFVESNAFYSVIGKQNPFMIHIAEQWHGEFGAPAADSINSTTYKHILRHSVFTLCPAGKSFDFFPAIFC